MVYKGMKILIIGGTGFIGFNLLKKLKNLRFGITSISLSYPKKNNFISGVNYVKLDITNQNEIKKINGNFDIVVNAGGYGGLDDNFRDTSKMYQNQIKGLKNVASFFLKKKIKRFIQVGSSLEYGSVSGIQTENSHPKNPISIYGKSKLNSTNYLKFLNKVYNFPVVVLRLYQVYGPNQKNNRLIPYVIDSIIKNKKIFTTKGDQIRDFCYIDDVTEEGVNRFHERMESIRIAYVSSLLLIDDEERVDATLRHSLSLVGFLEYISRLALLEKLDLRLAKERVVVKGRRHGNVVPENFYEIDFIDKLERFLKAYVLEVLSRQKRGDGGDGGD